MNIKHGKISSRKAKFFMYVRTPTILALIKQCFRQLGEINNDSITQYHKLIYWKAESILNKKLELLHFISEQNVNVSLSRRNLIRPTDKFHPSSFEDYRSDRTHTKGWGTAIFVKNIITHYHLSNTHSHIEYKIIRLRKPNHSTKKLTGKIYKKFFKIITKQ